MQRRDYKSKRFTGDKIGEDKFRRIIYFSKTKDLALIHYLGDETVAVDMPHGNAVHKTQMHRKTLKSTLAQISDNCKSGEPRSVYKDSVTKTGVKAIEQGVLNAKNRKQVENLRYKQNQEKKISHDSAYNTLQLAYNLENYVHEFAVYPEVKLVLACKELTDELNRLLMVKDIGHVLLSYDTTFDLGDFYVSPLIVKHPFFKGNQCFPVAFLIHDRKNQKSHDTFWREMISLVPNLLNSTPIIVTDREKAFSNAINSHIPNAKILLCWNHVKRDVKFWVKKQGGKSDDVIVYNNDVDSLLRADSEQDFDELFANLSEKWSTAFREHFEQNLKNELKEKACKYLLEDLDIFDPYSGITNNISEGFNTVFKHLLGWKHVPMDSIALSFYYLQQFYISEIIRGFCDVGDFQIRNEHRFRLRDPSTVEIPQNAVSPDEIVKHVKCEIELISESENRESEIPANATIIADQDEENTSVPPKQSTQRSIAIQAIKENKVYHCAQAQAFIVDGSKGDKYTVTLYPEKCVCPSLGTCWHIIAAKLSIGLDNGDEKKIYNLTQLNRNARKRPNKNAGKKKPRPVDREDELKIINPAPDSNLIHGISELIEPTDAIPLKDIETPPIKIMKTNSNTKRNRLSLSKRKLSIIKEETSFNTNNDKDSLDLTDSTSPVFKGKKSRLSLSRGKTSNIEEMCQTLNETSYREEIPESPINRPNNWVEFHNESLTLDHKNVISEDREICSDIINYACNIIKSQFKMSGLQHTGKVPFLNKKEKWEYILQFDSVGSSPSAQIHHTGKGHWVLSILYNDDIFVLDSLRGKVSVLTASMEIQLSKLYKTGRITVPFVQQQKNSVDCGIFALAFLVDFCVHGIEGLFDKVFDVNGMRNHLIRCIENNSFQNFPRLRVDQSQRDIDLQYTLLRWIVVLVSYRIFMMTWCSVTSAISGIMCAVLLLTRR